MVKTINIQLDDKTFKEIEKLKEAKMLSWPDFIIWASENAKATDARRRK